MAGTKAIAQVATFTNASVCRRIQMLKASPPVLLIPDAPAMKFDFCYAMHAAQNHIYATHSSSPMLSLLYMHFPACVYICPCAHLPEDKTRVKRDFRVVL